MLNELTKDVKSIEDIKKEKELKILTKKFENTKKENLKLLNEISKLKNSLDFNEFYKYNNYGDIVGFYPKILANIIEKKYSIITPMGEKNNIFVYSNGIYEKSTNLILKDIRAYISLKDQDNNSHENNTLETIARDTFINPCLLDAEEEYINFSNCLLNTETFEIENHSSSVYSTIQVKCNYNINLSKGIKETLFWKYLNTSLSIEYVDLIQEIIGYILSNSMDAQKFVTLLGDGKNGKSVLLNVLNAFYSEDFVSNVSIEDLQKKEFLAMLYGKKLNINGDIPDTFLENTDVIKKLTGEDKINAKALYSNPFDFHNKAKVIFSANKLPKSKDRTFGYYRRFLIIPFLKRISEEDKITKLSEKIIKNELDIIGSWAIDGLKRLIKNNFNFSTTQEMETVVKNYVNENNSILRFMNELTIKTDSKSDYIPVSELKKFYKNWCSVETKKPLSDFDFELKKEGYKQSTNNKVTTVRHWQCLAWIKNIVSEYNLYNDEIKGTKIDNTTLDKPNSSNNLSESGNYTIEGILNTLNSLDNKEFNKVFKKIKEINGNKNLFDVYSNQSKVNRGETFDKILMENMWDVWYNEVENADLEEDSKINLCEKLEQLYKNKNGFNLFLSEYNKNPTSSKVEFLKDFVDNDCRQ